MILSFFGILFVLDAHLGNSIGFLSNLFPYDSFFMPMFVFISGYFYKTIHSDTNIAVFRYILYKLKTLLAPYLFWVAFYGVLNQVLRAVGLVKFGGHSIPVILYEICSSGWSYGFNDPTWFIPLLFSVCIVYCLLRRVSGRFWNDLVVSPVLISLGALSVFLSKTDFCIPTHYLLLKVGFFLQFFHIGFVFRKYIEIWFDKINTLSLCMSMIVVNIILLAIYGTNIAFPNCASMGNFRTDNLLLPLITSLTGTAFWLKISKAVVPILGNNPVVNYISSNTFFIMTHHLFSKWIFHGLLLVGKKAGIPNFADVNSSQFVSDPWYIFGQNTWISSACFLFMLFFCVLSCHFLQATLRHISSGIQSVRTNAN